MFILVGLGNPGNSYENTRHNIGFMLIDQIATEAGVSVSQNRFNSLTSRATWNGHDVFLMKPMSYMNLSGSCVQQAFHFFKAQENQLIVIFDDLDQPFGAVKMRVGGGHGGHNGMRDILLKTGFDKFTRIKVGIGKPEHKGATANWVLSKFTNTELQTLESESFPLAKSRILDAIKNSK